LRVAVFEDERSEISGGFCEMRFAAFVICDVFWRNVSMET